MAFEKINYIDKETVITAKNLNDIQVAIIDLEDVITNEMIDAICGQVITVVTNEVEF